MAAIRKAVLGLFSSLVPAAAPIVFDSCTEVGKVDLSPVNPSSFEVPSGYSRE